MLAAMSESRDRRRPSSNAAAAFGLAAALALGGCGSDPETAHDLPPPDSVSRPVFKTPPPRNAMPAPTLGRVVEESERRRRVIRQLDAVFENSQP